MKRWSSYIFALLIFVSCFSVDASAETYTNRDDVSGNMYTTSLTLATALDSIFDGNASIYSDGECTSIINTKIGTYTVPDNKVTIYAGTKGTTNSGTSCWLYANGVYFTLFGELTGNGEAQHNSERLNILSSSKPTYKNFQAWHVRNTPGALIRTVEGHSMIVLKYTKECLTVLEGNGDGNGIVQIREIPWESWENGSPEFTVDYIIQPKDEYYEELYGYLSDCKLYTSWGTIKITKKTTVKTYPCSKSTYGGSKDIENPKRETEYVVNGLYKNTAGNYWYRVEVNGTTGYVYAGDASYSVSTDVVLARGRNYFSIDGKIRSCIRDGKLETIIGYD